MRTHDNFIIIGTYCLVVLSAIILGSCSKPSESNRVAPATYGSMDGAVNDTCNGAANFHSDEVSTGFLVSGSDSTLWIKVDRSDINVQIGIYLDWPLSTGAQTDYIVYYDPFENPSDPNNADNRLLSTYFGLVPNGVEVTSFTAYSGGAVLSKLILHINDVQVYRVNTSGPGMLKCIDQVTIQI